MVIVSEVAAANPVELMVKLAVPEPIPIIFMSHDGALKDSIQLLGVIEITELLLLVIATTTDSLVVKFATPIVAVADSPIWMFDSLNDEINN